MFGFRIVETKPLNDLTPQHHRRMNDASDASVDLSATMMHSKSFIGLI
jgi:hypothetical protein